MNIAYLESFVKVVECASMAEAARRLDITPGAVAARVRSLEEDLSAVLLQRSGQTVKPTPIGLHIYERARALIQQARDLRAVASTGTLSGELRLGAFISGLTTHLPGLLADFCTAWPDLSIHVSYAPSAELCRRVHSGDLDVALVIEPPFAIQKTCAWLTLQEEPLVVIAPLSMAGREAHDLLTNERFIRYDRAAISGALVDRYLKDNGIVPRQRVEIDSLLTIASLVERGVGVSLVPDSFSLQPLASRLIRLPVPARSPIRRIGFIWGRRGPRTALAEALVRHGRASFREVTDHALAP